MHVQIINFQLKNLAEPDYAAICRELAPAFAAVPGLLSKVWLANSTTKTYGGVYFWRDRKSMEQFAQTDLFKSVATHPTLTGIASTDFDTMEEPTKVTRGFHIAD